MPLIDLHVREEDFTDEEKAMQDATSGRIHEVKNGLWGGAEGVWTTERALALKARE